MIRVSSHYPPDETETLYFLYIMGEAKMHISPDTIIDGKMIKDMTIEEKNYLIATYKAKRNIELIIDENKEK